MLVVWPQMVLTIIGSVILYGAAQEGKTVCLCYHGSKGVKDALSFTSHTINSQSQWLSVSAKCAWNNSYERDYGSVEYSKSFVNSTGNVQLDVRNYGSLNSWTLDQSFDLQGHTRSYSCSSCSWFRLISTTVSNNRRNTLRQWKQKTANVWLDWAFFVPDEVTLQFRVAFCCSRCKAKIILSK